MHTHVFRISTTTQLTHYDFLITVQIAPLDCWDCHTEISVVIHNSPHWSRGIVTFWMWEWFGSVNEFVNCGDPVAKQ